MEEKIREEIETCRNLIEENEVYLKDAKGWEDGYLKGKIAGLKREIRKLKEILGEEV